MSENGKWQIGFWVITCLVIGSFGWTTFCSWNNQQKIEKLFDRQWELKDVANDALHKIDLRLTRIEYKLLITENK